MTKVVNQNIKIGGSKGKYIKRALVHDHSILDKITPKNKSQYKSSDKFLITKENQKSHPIKKYLMLVEIWLILVFKKRANFSFKIDEQM